MATLVVSVLQGRQLVNVESGGGGLSLFKSSKEERKSDPYAVVVYKGNVQNRSQSQKRGGLTHLGATD